MPTWTVHQRISPRKTLDLEHIMDRPSIEVALRDAMFLYDLTADEVVLKPHH